MNALAPKTLAILAVQVAGWFAVIYALWLILASLTITVGEPDNELARNLFQGTFVLCCASISGLAAMQLGIRRRRISGRVLGIVFLTLIALFFLTVALGRIFLASRMGEPMADFFLLLLLPVPFLYWTYAFGFSSGARRYFGGVIETSA